MNQRINICNIYFDNLTLENSVEIVSDLIKENKLSYIVTPNVDHVVKLQNDNELKKIYDEATLVLVDGMPIVWAGKFLGTPFKGRVAGVDFFYKLCELSAKKGYKLFFLGGRPEAAKITSEIFLKKYPNIQIVGACPAPIGFENSPLESKKIVDMLIDAKPDILFLGVGSPRQEKWIYKHRVEYKAPVSISIGGSFDVAAGMIKRAPLWMQNIGLEWLWRLLMEPRRLWRRYLVEDIIFFRLIFKQKCSK